MCKRKVQIRLSTRFLIPLSAIVLFTIPALGFAGGVSERVQAEDLVKQGNRYYQDRQYENAVESYQKAIAIGFEGTSVYYNLGDSFTTAVGWTTMASFVLRSLFRLITQSAPVITRKIVETKPIMNENLCKFGLFA